MPNPAYEVGIPWLRTERRSKPRAQILLQVECRGRDAISLGRSINISESGLVMVTPELLELNCEVTIRFALPVLPQQITIEAKGRVVRVQKEHYTMAIQFVVLADDQRSAIRNFVASES